MNLESLPNEVLLRKTESLAREERSLGLQVLWHLREIDRRRLYSFLEYGSLFEYATRHLRYSDGAAQRRIEAMRLLREIPEVEEKVKEGTLSLSALSLVGQVTRKARKTKDEKREILRKIEGKSKRECERVLAEEVPGAFGPLFPERERVVTSELTEIRLTLTDEQMKKLKRARSLLSHRNPNPSYAELLELLSDQVIKILDPSEKTPRKKPSEARASPDRVSPDSEDRVSPASVSQVSVSPTPPAESKLRLPSRTAVPASLRREVWRTAQGKCSRCGSTHRLEIDHITPRARNGANERGNLRLLCRSCNLFEAQRVLGPRLMARRSPPRWR